MLFRHIETSFYKLYSLICQKLAKFINRFKRFQHV